MRLVTRAELRSVICGGSMVTGSARRPITMASLGGAAPAPEVRATARIARAIFKVRRIVMGCSFGRQFASSRSPAQSGPESLPIELCAQQGVPLTDESPAEAIALRAQELARARHERGGTPWSSATSTQATVDRLPGLRPRAGRHEC